MAERARLIDSGRKIEPIPSAGISTGAARNLQNFAEGFARLGERVQDQLDVQAAREGFEAGIVAGLGPKFQPLADDTIRGRAYDRAGLNVFANQTEIRSQQKIDELYDEHRADPIALKAALNGWRDGFRAELLKDTPAIVPVFDASFERNSRPVVRAAEEAFRQNLEREAEATLTQALETSFNSAGRLAYLSDGDAQAAAALTAERNAFIDKLVEHGPKQAFNFEGRTLGTDITRRTVLKPAQMQKALSDWDENAQSQMVLGRFSRAPDKKAFLKEFSEVQRKDPSSPMSLPAVARVEARMAAQVEAEERVEMQRVLAAERAERLADKARRDTQEANAVIAYDAINRGALTLDQLDAAGRNRLIDRDVWRALRDSMTKPPVESADDQAELFHDDAIIQGQGSRTAILADPSLRPDSKRRLLDKLDAHNRRPDERSPYQVMVASNQYGEVKDALRRDIITTGPFAALETGEQQRLNRAFREVDDRIRQGLANGSLKSSADLWALYDDMGPRFRAASTARDLNGLERPRFGGVPQTVEDVAALRADLAGRVRAGGIDPATAGREALLLDEYQRILAERPPPAPARANRR